MNETNNKNKLLILPVIPLRGLVAIPGTHLHFDVGRKVSIKAIETAMKTDQIVFLVAQKDIRDDEPKPVNLYKMGTIVKIKQILKMPNESIKLLVECLSRAIRVEWISETPYYEAKINEIETINPTNDIKAETLIRNAQEMFDEYCSFIPKMPSEVVMNILTATNAGQLADYITANILIKYQDKQLILETVEPLKRLENLLLVLSREIEILSLDREINEKVKGRIDKNQREYYLREQIKTIQGELGEFDSCASEADEYFEKIYKLNLETIIEEKLTKETNRLAKLPYGSHEGTVIRNYLDMCLELPWNKYSKENINLEKAEKILNADHYGLIMVKERILEYLAVRILSNKVKGQIICLVGPPGVGKTSIACSVAKALGRKFARISLGGIRDEAEIRGHRKTYIGAMAGRIINGIKQAGTKNPVIVLDEIDKLGNDFKGDPSSALLEVLDPEQNKAFRDHFIELPFDLSDVLFITTANMTDTIPRPLLDRMEKIEITSYTAHEKMEIAKRHLIPKQFKRHGLNKNSLKITDEALNELINGWTKEAGVRTLEREIASLCRKVAKKMVSQKINKITIDKLNIESFLGSKKYKKDELSLIPQIGIVTGLAWTSVGGEMLSIEVNAMEGTGKIELTGSLGDVMKESAKAAISYIRSRTEILGIDKDFYKNKDIHIHVPEGAVPKDGPSAGITIATAIVSELTGNPVRGDIAMTGEITLRGRVLPIGGLREKTMAAFKAGIKTILIPTDNVSDLEKVEDVVKKAINFIAVDDMDKVLENAIIFSKKPQSKTQDDNQTLNIPLADNITSYITH